MQKGMPADRETRYMQYIALLVDVHKKRHEEEGFLNTETLEQSSSAEADSFTGLSE